MLVGRLFGFAFASTLALSLAGLGGCSSQTEPDPGDVAEEAASSEQALRPVRSCAAVLCAPGTHCELVRRRATCVADDPCALVRCAAGTHCEASGGSASCVTDTPSCVTNADCNLVDNYCGGCTCLALATSQSPPTCSNPVNCFAQPCGFGQTAACVAGNCVVVP